MLCLVVAAMEAFTMYVLAKFAERYDANRYEDQVMPSGDKKLGQQQQPDQAAPLLHQVEHMHSLNPVADSILLSSLFLVSCWVVS